MSKVQMVRGDGASCGEAVVIRISLGNSSPVCFTGQRALMLKAARQNLSFKWDVFNSYSKYSYDYASSYSEAMK